MSALRLVLSAWLCIIAGWAVGVAYPPCCPGEQRSCSAGEHAGVSYCRENGWGWERCQRLAAGGAYPQALWRGKGER